MAVSAVDLVFVGFDMGSESHDSAAIGFFEINDRMEAEVARVFMSAQPQADYETWRAKTDPLSVVQQGTQVDLEDYHALIDLDPDSILARDLKLDHIRRFAGAHGHSQYDHWARREER